MTKTTSPQTQPKIEILAGDPGVHWVCLSASVAMPLGTQLREASTAAPRPNAINSYRRTRGQSTLLAVLSVAFVASTWVAVHFIREFNDRGRWLAMLASELNERNGLTRFDRAKAENDRIWWEIQQDRIQRASAEVPVLQEIYPRPVYSGEMREPPPIVVPPAMPAEIQFNPVAPNEN